MSQTGVTENRISGVFWYFNWGLLQIFSGARVIWLKLLCLAVGFFFKKWGNTSLRIKRIIVSFSFIWSLFKYTLTCPGEQLHDFITFGIGSCPQYSICFYCLLTKAMLFGSSNLKYSMTRGALIVNTSF